MKNLNKNRVFRFNRRIRGQTDYKQRLRLLKSGFLRAVVRKSNKNMLVQVVEYGEDGDRIISSAKSNELTKQGFTLNTGNLSAAYLTGLLAGKKALKKGVKGDVIVDFGLQEVISGNRLFAAVNGLVDSGIQVRVNDEVFPSQERLEGAHLNSKDAKSVFDKVKKSIEGMK